MCSLLAVSCLHLGKMPQICTDVWAACLSGSGSSASLCIRQWEQSQTSSTSPTNEESRQWKQGITVAAGGKKTQLKRLLLSLLHLTNVPSWCAHVHTRACARLGNSNRFSTHKSCTEREDLEIVQWNCCSCPLNSISVPILIDNSNNSLKQTCGLMRFRRMSCECNFKTPTVGKMEEVSVSVGLDGGGGEKDRVKTCLYLKREKKALLRRGWRPKNKEASHQILSKVEKVPTAAALFQG